MNLPTTAPELTTERLLLRPLSTDDAETVARLAADPELQGCALWLPEEKGKDAAAAWIEHSRQQAIGPFGLIDRERGIFYGAAALVINAGQESGELRLWIGRPFQRKGWATEAAKRLMRAAFETWELHRLEARHSMQDPAAERFLSGLGFLPEGVRRHAEKRNGAFEDVAHYGVLRSDLSGIF